MLYGSKVDPSDANDTLAIVAGMVPDGSRVLDVGCGVGNFACFLTEARHCAVTGVEISPTMADMARAHCREVVVGNVEQDKIREQLVAAGPYDCIVFADVLEHLVYPLAVLRAMRAALTSEGCVLVSLPNVAHWTVRLRLAVGRFEYTDGFLLDRTHLRFFTLASARRLVAQSGYEIEREVVRWAPLPGDRLWQRAPFLRNSVNRAVARMLPGLFGYQFIYSLRSVGL